MDEPCRAEGADAGAGTFGEAQGSLTSDPGAQQMLHPPGSALLLIYHVALDSYPSILHHASVWKIVMLSGRGRIWGCPRWGTPCLGVSFLPRPFQSSSAHVLGATSLHFTVKPGFIG